MAWRFLCPGADNEDRRDLCHVTPSDAGVPLYGLRQGWFFQSINNESRVKARLKQDMEWPMKIQLWLRLSQNAFSFLRERR